MIQKLSRSQKITQTTTQMTEPKTIRLPQSGETKIYFTCQALLLYLTDGLFTNFHQIQHGQFTFGNMIRILRQRRNFFQEKLKIFITSILNLFFLS